MDDPNTTMTVTLGDLAEKVEERVRSGEYDSASEVVRAGLEALEREERRHRRPANLPEKLAELDQPRRAEALHFGHHAAASGGGRSSSVEESRERARGLLAPYPERTLALAETTVRDRRCRCA